MLALLFAFVAVLAVIGWTGWWVEREDTEALQRRVEEGCDDLARIVRVVNAWENRPDLTDEEGAA